LKMTRSESFVIPFLFVPRGNVWLTPTAREPCRNAPIYENARLNGHKVNFAQGKIPSAGKSPKKCIYNVPAQKKAKRRAKFG